MSTPLMRMKMNKTQQSQILWLSGLLSLCILFLSLVKPPASEESKRWNPLTTLSPQDVHTIEMTHLNTRWKMIRKEEGWSISEPFHGLGEQEKIDRLLKNISSAQCGQPIATEKENYGLTSPRWSFSLNNGAVSFDIGNDVPVGWNSYVVCYPDTSVRLSREKWNSLLEPSIENYQDKRLLSITSALIDKIVFADGTELQRDGNGWGQVHPVIQQVSDVSVQQWLEDLNTLRGERVSMTAPPSTTDHIDISLYQGEFAQHVYRIDEQFWSPLQERWFTLANTDIFQVSATDFLQPTSKKQED